MKKIFILLIFCCVPLAGICQGSSRPSKDSVNHSSAEDEKAKWGVEADVSWQAESKAISIKTMDMAADYKHSLNPNIGKIQLKDTSSTGLNFLCTYFLKKHERWGISSGVYFAKHSGYVNLDNFHIEYQSTDFQGKIFRQLITAKQQIKEQLSSTVYSIPLLISLRAIKGNKIRLYFDFGCMYDLKYQTAYSTNASFDYEAIYQYVKDANGKPVAVYDNSPTPSGSKDWFITRSQYATSNLAGMTKAFDTLRMQGYNVALNASPKNNSGKVSTTKSSFSFLLRAQFKYNVFSDFYLNAGGYFMYQITSNSANDKKLTDSVGSYNSLLNSIKSLQGYSYGVNIGLSWFFNREKS